MAAKMIKQMEVSLADKMRDKGKPEKKNESSEYGKSGGNLMGPAAFIRKTTRGVGKTVNKNFTMDKGGVIGGQNKYGKGMGSGR